MKAVLQLELFGDNIIKEIRYMEGLYRCIPGGDKLWGESEKFPKPWIAKIIGKDSKYKYAREFLKPKKDYTHSNSKGSRGIFLNYTLESGCLYDVNSQISWKNWDRYFCTVDDDGEILKLDSYEVDQWLQSQNALSE